MTGHQVMEVRWKYLVRIDLMVLESEVKDGDSIFLYLTSTYVSNQMYLKTIVEMEKHNEVQAFLD